MNASSYGKDFVRAALSVDKKARTQLTTASVLLKVECLIYVLFRSKSRCVYVILFKIITIIFLIFLWVCCGDLAGG